MKKNIMFILMLFPVLARAQQLLPISTNSGQQYADISTKVITNPGDSLKYEEYWCFNSNCGLSNLDLSSVQTLIGGASVDTISMTNTVEVQNLTLQPIVVYIQRLLTDLITGDTLGNIIMPVTIYPDFGGPLVSYTTYTSNTDTISISYSVVPNDTSAEVKFWARYQDCNAPQIWPLHTEIVSGFTLQNLEYKIDAAFGCGYDIAVFIEIVNSVGSDSTGSNCMSTSSCAPYVTTYDSVVTSVTTADLFGRAIGQNMTVIDSVALPGQPYFAGVSISVSGQATGEVSVHQQITNLSAGTLYWFKRCVLDSSGIIQNCQGPVPAQTLQAPVMLSLAIAGSFTTSSVNQQINIQYTSAVDGTLFPVLSDNQNFTGVNATPIPNSSMDFTGGQSILLYNVSQLSANLYGSQFFQNGMTYWVKFEANNQNGQMFTSTSSSFVFGNPTGITEIYNQYNELSIYGDYVGYIEIADLSGRVLIQTVKETPEMKIVHDLKPGLYAVRGSGIKGKKFSIGF